MGKKLMMLGVMLLAFGCLAWADSWTGTVSDSMCGAKHAHAGADAAKCVAKCVAGGNKYVLVSGDKVYQVDNQDAFKDYAGKSVKVTGTLTGDAITVEKVDAAGKKKASNM
ncbi:MAG: DUF5818 domain-containing protein [Terriglobia bacterium]